MGGASLLLPIVEQPAVVIAVITMMRMRMGSRLGMERDSLALAFYLGACWSLWCLGRAGSTLGLATRSGQSPMGQEPHSWVLGTRTAGSSAVTLLMRSPRSRIRPWSPPPRGTCWVRSWYTSLSGQHDAAVGALRSAEGVHVDADERAVGTERRAGGAADDERVFVSGDDQLGRAD